jgi:hypothetical protein
MDGWAKSPPTVATVRRPPCEWPFSLMAELISPDGTVGGQVTVVVKQMLSLVAGGTVDLLVAQKMHDMSSSHTWARLILRLRNLLWPGGTPSPSLLRTYPKIRA